MRRFVEYFYNDGARGLVKKINEYADKHNLNIIQLSFIESHEGAYYETIVIFETE